jgi:hypothetical protein
MSHSSRETRNMVFAAEIAPFCVADYVKNQAGVTYDPRIFSGARHGYPGVPWAAGVMGSGKIHLVGIPHLSVATYIKRTIARDTAPYVTTHPTNSKVWNEVRIAEYVSVIHRGFVRGRNRNRQVGEKGKRTSSVAPTPRSGASNEVAGLVGLEGFEEEEEDEEDSGDVRVAARRPRRM